MKIVFTQPLLVNTTTQVIARQIYCLQKLAKLAKACLQFDLYVRTHSMYRSLATLKYVDVECRSAFRFHCQVSVPEL